MHALHVKMKNPETGKIEIMTPQNALDMEQHNGWRRIGHVKVKGPYVANPQDVLDNPRGIARRTNAANASLDVAPDIEEEEVADLGEADLSDTDTDVETEMDEEPEDTDPDADPEDDDLDPPSTRDAIRAGR